MSSASPPATTASPWFRSPSFDFALILCVPFLTWPLVAAANDAWGPVVMAQLILLTATGHYFATFVRAYGDRELFARFRVRFVAAPVVLALTCVGMFVGGYGAQLMVVVTAWAFWHWLAQAFGFARIYDSKVGSFDARTALLDKALVVAGFVGTATLTDGAVATFGKLALDAGMALPAPATVAALQSVVGVGVLVVAVAYLANLVATIVAGRPWSWQKQLMHVTTIGYYWFAFAWLPNVLIAHVLYELFHDIQYFAITWITCQGRSRRPGVTRWMRSMFRPSWLAAAVFIGTMVALGGVDALGRHSFDAGMPRNVWLGVFVTLALLHYYYDGFIWKARESALGADLGIQHGLRAAVVPSARHAAAWSAFFLPLGALVFTADPIPPRERVDALAAIAPDDFYSQSELALALTRERKLEDALARYQHAISLNPDFGPTHVLYGAALELHRDADAARDAYERALACPPSDRSHVDAHVNLGALLAESGDLADGCAPLVQAGETGLAAGVERLLGLSAAMPPSEAGSARSYFE
ncbi:MAG: tetratricopeptide repeat protein, partial [Planctomycetota bacterium]|nr:tetratricopeptide repeat protein [Planctomycetota bacterium]